ncbi:MAG: hypothetical protein CL549_14110 [Alcanivorax sp.]|nr:hypothetical protein A3Q32_03190 [Alcanivorax sp. KX64203]MAO58790.1 hypothetical protein [Alcanivorax sp.]MAY11593.1 hypothetical protein [Alcanivorax sp.]MBI53930.1 hypothetical protein [Alcanivorax sp.]
MAAGNDHDGKDRTGRVYNDVYRTVKRRIAVVLHDAVDQVLAVTVECGRATLGFYNAGIGFNQTENDESTTMVGQGEHRLCEGRLVIVRALQIKPVLDLAIEIFPRINQQV